MFFITQLFQADPALQRLPAPGLRGTWARAYSLLTRLVSQIGWDELLKTRSSVFVMEEEYRMQKAQGDFQQVAPAVTNGNTGVDGDEANGDAGRVVIHEDGTVRSVVDDNASTRAIVSTDSPRISTSTTEVNGSNFEGDSVIPTIKISTEADVDEEVAAAKAEGPVTDENVKQNGIKETTLEKPVQAAAGEEDRSGGDSSPAPVQEHFSFSNKRLCERWLDNLFMVLYEVRQLLSPSSIR